MSTWLRDVKNEFLDLAKQHANDARRMKNFGLPDAAGFHARKAYHFGLLARPELRIAMEADRA